MKKIYFLLLVLYCQNLFSQNNVGIGIATPDPSAILDLTSNAKGFLVPRMTATQRLAIPAPATGLMVFDTDTGCTFFYTGAAWRNLCVSGGGYNDSIFFGPGGTVSVVDAGGTKTSPQSAWMTNGNSGTSAASNYAGTSDGQDFVLKSNNAEVMRLTTAGAVGINQPAPNSNAVLDIQSNNKGVLFPALTSTQRDAIATPPVGLTIYNSTLNVHQFWNGTCWVNVGQTVCEFSYALSYQNPTHNSDCLLVSNFSSVSDTLRVDLVSGTGSPVIFSAIGVPAGVLVSFSNNYVTPNTSDTTVMTFTALPSAASGTYTITILATSGSTVQTLTYTLVVFGFDLSLTPTDTTISAGSLTSGGYISQALVSIGNSSACGNSGGTAILSATGAPGTINVSFGTTNLAIPGSTVMTITSNCPLAGTYPITVQAMVGVTSSYATYTLTITPPTPIHVTTSQSNLDLASLIGAGHCAGSDTIYIDAGVTICSANAGLPAITTGAIPAGGSLTIINNGTITGAGGAGGVDPGNLTSSSCPTANGQNGGDAIFIASSINTKIINNGTISSGGGGGGAGAALSGASLSACVFTGTAPGGSGGGGAGCSPGAGGANAGCSGGSNGTATTGGAGGPTQNGGGCGCSGIFGIGAGHAGAGGAGGALGLAGANGGTATTGTGVCPAGQGGAAGYSVNGNGCSCVTLTGNAVVGPTRP